MITFLLGELGSRAGDLLKQREQRKRLCDARRSMRFLAAGSNERGGREERDVCGETPRHGVGPACRMRPSHWKRAGA